MTTIAMELKVALRRLSKDRRGAMLVVAGMATASAVCLAIVAALFPVFYLKTMDRAALSAKTERVVAGKGVRGLGMALLLVEMTLAVTLLVICLNAASVVVQLERKDYGIARDELVYVGVPLPAVSYAQDNGRFYRTLVERLRQSLPVSAVAVDDRPPLSGVPLSYVSCSPAAPHDRSMTGLAIMHHVTPGYFAAMGLAVTFRHARGLAIADSAARVTISIIAAAIGAVVAIMGIYGVLCVAVSARRKEIGIRLALGESHRSVSRRFIQQGALIMAIGAFSGVLTASGIARVLHRVIEVGAGIRGEAILGALLILLPAGLLAAFLAVRRVVFV